MCGYIFSLNIIQYTTSKLASHFGNVCLLIAISITILLLTNNSWNRPEIRNK